MKSRFELDLAVGDGVSVATLEGELTLPDTDELWRQLVPALPGPGDLIVDLTSVTFLDSAGINVLFRLSRLMAERGGFLRLAVPEGAPVYRIIRIVDPSGAIPRYTVVEDAMTAAQAR